MAIAIDGNCGNRQDAVVEPQLRKRRGLKTIGATDDIRTQFYAITAERNLQHPAVVAIRNSARRELSFRGNRRLTKSESLQFNGASHLSSDGFFEVSVRIPPNSSNYYKVKLARFR
jgi:hypothetical protein